MHDAQAVRHGQCFFLIVRDEQERDADAPLDVLQLRANLFAQIGIERRERFVEQQDVGLQHQRSRQGHALALAA